MHEKHTWPTYTRTPIVHVRETRLAYIHNYPYNSAFFAGATAVSATFWHIPGLHTLGPQSSTTIGTGFWRSLHEKHTWPTYTRTPILHVQKHTWPTYTRTPIFHHHRHGVLAQLARKLHTKHTWPTYPRTPIVHVRQTRPAYIHSDPNLPPP